MTSGVDFTREDYNKFLPIWRTVEDATAGQYAIKQKTDKYLPNFTRSTINETISNGDENLRVADTQNAQRYKQYLKRAIYYNFTGRTLAGLVGLLFEKGVTFQAGSETDEYLEETVDTHGLTLEQQMKATSSAVTGIGRSFLMVDFPQSDGVTTVAEAGTRRAGIIRYPAENVINWWLDDGVLSLVVIKEVVLELSDDGFGQEEVVKYRVLRLDDAGFYVQEVYRGEEFEDSFKPTDSDGNRLDFIPALFPGSENNEANIDQPPMIDIADVNIGHYRNSADFENSSWLVGQPQPWVAGLTSAWADSYFKNGLVLGSGAGVLLPEGGSMGIETADPNTLAMTGMEHKEKALQALGARMLTATTANTATEALIDSSTEKSVMMTIQGNIEDAYNKCFEWVSVFNGTEPATVEINANLSQLMLNPQMVQAMIQAWQGGLIGSVDARAIMREGGLIERTDEKIDEDVDQGIDLDQQPNPEGDQ